jgi:hypothetical protein
VDLAGERDCRSAVPVRPGSPYGAGQHRGVDIGGDAGEQVRAPAPGVVSFVGSVPGSGQSVTVETGDGWSVTLTHLGTTVVTKGATVAEGDGVGTIGPSGDPEVSGPYVHLGVRHTDDDQGYVDPLAFLPPQSLASSSPEARPSAQPVAPVEPVVVPTAPVVVPDVSAPSVPRIRASGPSAATLVAPDPRSATPASAAASIVHDAGGRSGNGDDGRRHPSSRRRLRRPCAGVARQRRHRHRRRPGARCAGRADRHPERSRSRRLRPSADRRAERRVARGPGEDAFATT